MNINLTMASPLPADGWRRLTGAEAAKRASAMKCIREQHAECLGQVYVNLFFDGTGNPVCGFSQRIPALVQSGFPVSGLTGQGDSR